jgi:hypothetical protein
MILSRWRAKALELFPEMRSEIQTAETVGAVWVTLAFRFQGSYDAEQSTDEMERRKLIRNICLYAVWCTRSKSFDAQQAAWISFYEGLPKFAIRCEPSIYKKIVRELIENLGIEEIERSAGTITAYMTSAESKKFLADVRQAEQERQKRSRKRSNS